MKMIFFCKNVRLALFLIINQNGGAHWGQHQKKKNDRRIHNATCEFLCQLKTTTRGISSLFAVSQCLMGSLPPPPPRPLPFRPSGCPETLIRWDLSRNWKSHWWTPKKGKFPSPFLHQYSLSINFTIKLEFAQQPDRSSDEYSSINGTRNYKSIKSEICLFFGITKKKIEKILGFFAWCKIIDSMESSKTKTATRSNPLEQDF